MTLAWCVLALFLSVADDTATAKADEVQEIWPMCLKQAMELGLRQCSTIRVIFAPDWSVRVGCTFGAPPQKKTDTRPLPGGASRSSIVVYPLAAHADLPRLNVELTEIVRSVERDYRHLAAAHVALWAADRAVDRARDLIAIDEAFGDPDCPQDLDDLAATRRRLQRLEKEFVDRTAELNAAERRFRVFLGVPTCDSRRIGPISPPTEAPLVFAWDTCLESVPTNHSLVVRPKATLPLAEAKPDSGARSIRRHSLAAILPNRRRGLSCAVVLGPSASSEFG